LILIDYITQQNLFTFISDRPVDGLLAFTDWIKSKSFMMKFDLLPMFMLKDLEVYLRNQSHGYIIKPDRDAYDYVISPAKIVNAEGSEYSDYRHKIATFNRLYAESIELKDFDPNNTNDVKLAVALANRWAERKKQRNELYEDELYAFSRFLLAAKFSENLRFCAFSQDGELVGLASTEILSDKFAVGHFLKYDPAIKSIYYKLVSSMCVQLNNEGIQYLNIEQDLGIPGLREAKLKLRPIDYLEKFSLEIKA